MDRRDVLKGLGGSAATAGIIGGGVLAMSGGARAQVNGISVSNAETTTDDGTITGLTLDFDGQVVWDGFDAEVGGIQVEMAVNGQGGGNIVTSGVPFDVPNGHAGTGDFTLEDVDLLSSAALDAEDLTSDVDGEAKTTNITLQLTVRFFRCYTGENGCNSNQTNRITDEGIGNFARTETDFDVTVQNEEAYATLSGEGNPSVQGSDQDPTIFDPDELGLTWSTGFCTFRIDNRNSQEATVTLSAYGGGEDVEMTVPGDHYGYPTAEGPGGHDPSGVYLFIPPNDYDVTGQLFYEGEEIDTKAAGSCSLGEEIGTLEHEERPVPIPPEAFGPLLQKIFENYRESESLTFFVPEEIPGPFPEGIVTAKEIFDAITRES